MEWKLIVQWLVAIIHINMHEQLSLCFHWWSFFSEFHLSDALYLNSLGHVWGIRMTDEESVYSQKNTFYSSCSLQIGVLGAHLHSCSVTCKLTLFLPPITSFQFKRLILKLIDQSLFWWLSVICHLVVMIPYISCRRWQQRGRRYVHRNRKTIQTDRFLRTCEDNRRWVKYSCG